MAKPRHPSSSPFFSLAADPVQQGLFATSSYEAKTKTKPPKPIVVDKRQVDMFGSPIGPLDDEDDEPRENDGSQKFFRRTPVQKRRGEAKREHKWRYTYDVDAALRGKVRALIGEKIRLPYKGVFGHYEVLRRLPLGNLDNTVAVLHDETGHLMAINEACLRQLARDVYRPAEGTTSAEDVRHRHEREDALPRSRYEALRAIEDASGIEDHDFATADDAYHAWKTAGAKQAGAKIEDEEKVEGAAKKKKRGPRTKRPPKPPPWRGGQLDAFEGDLKNKKHFTSLLEAFEHATRGAKTWRDLSPVLVQLESALGVPVRFPNDVLDRQGEHERDLRDFSEGIDVEQYGVTLEQSDDIEGDIFMAATMDPPAPEPEPDPEGMKMVTFIVPCGNAKLSHAAPARDLYTGSQFRYVFSLAEAAAERTGGEVFILSGLHGLVEPDRVLEPYKKKMGDPGSIEVEQLRKQVRRLGLAGREVYALLPRSRKSPYYERLEAALQAEGGHAVDVFDVPTKTAKGGRIGMGEQKTRAREFLSSFTPRQIEAKRVEAKTPRWIEEEHEFLDERFERAMRDQDRPPSTVPPSTVPLLLTVTEDAIVAKASDGRRWRLDDEQAAECVQQMDAGETVDTQSWKQLPPEDAVPQEVEDHGEAVVEADMAQGADVHGLRCVYFASGSNHQGEIEGLSSIGFNVGVAAPELSEGALQALTDLAGTGIRVFVDSGAFGEVDFNFPNATARPKKKNKRSKRQIELGMVASTPPGGLPYPNLPMGPLVLEEITPARWRAILKTYRVLAEALGSQVYLVAPDCVGHQDETLRRLKTYAREIRELHRMGANIIVAMQKAVTLDVGHLDPSAPGISLGKLSREALDERIEAILGFSDFVRGMPMRNRTTTTDEVVDFLKKRPHVMRVHLLGFGPASRVYVETLKKLAAVRPGLDLTCDSVLIVAQRGKTNGPGGGPRRLTKAEDEYWRDELGPASFDSYNDAGDYTDAIGEPSGWLPQSAREQLADQWGLDKAQRRAWLKDPDTWLQDRDDPEGPKNYELPHVAFDLDQAWADYNFREKVVERKRVGIQRAFGPGSGFSLTREADEDE